MSSLRPLIILIITVAFTAQALEKQLLVPNITLPQELKAKLDCTQLPKGKVTQFQKLVASYKHYDLATLYTDAETIITSNKNPHKAFAIIQAAQQIQENGGDSALDFTELSHRLSAQSSYYCTNQLDPERQYYLTCKNYFIEEASDDARAKTFENTKFFLKQALTKQPGDSTYCAPALWLYEQLQFDDCLNDELASWYKIYDQALELLVDGHYQECNQLLTPLLHEKFIPALFLSIILNNFYDIVPDIELYDLQELIKRMKKSNYPPSIFLSIAGAKKIDPDSNTVFTEQLKAYTYFDAAESFLLLGIIKLISEHRSAENIDAVQLLIEQSVRCMDKKAQIFIPYLLQNLKPIILNHLAEHYYRIVLDNLTDQLDQKNMLSKALDMLMVLHEVGSIWATIYLMPFTYYNDKNYATELETLLLPYLKILCQKPWLYLPSIEQSLHAELYTILKKRVDYLANDSTQSTECQQIEILYMLELLHPTLTEKSLLAIKMTLRKELKKKESRKRICQMCLILQEYPRDEELCTLANKLITNNSKFNFPEFRPTIEAYRTFVHEYLEKTNATKQAIDAFNAKFFNPQASAEFGLYLAQSDKTVSIGLATMYLRYAIFSKALSNNLMRDCLITLTKTLYNHPMFQQHINEKIICLLDCIKQDCYAYKILARLLYEDNKGSQIWEFYPKNIQKDSTPNSLIAALLFAALARQSSLENPKKLDEIVTFLNAASAYLIHAIKNNNAAANLVATARLKCFCSALETIIAQPNIDASLRHRAQTLYNIAEHIKTQE